MASSFKDVALAAAGSLERRLFKSPVPLSQIRNFVLLQFPSALGTAIHATPLIAALHASITGARIAAAASGFALEILQQDPGLERVVASPSPLADLRGCVRSLRAAHFFPGEPCAVLQTSGNERSRVTLAALLAGLHVRVGFSVVPGFSSAPLAFDPRISLIANNLRLLGPLGHTGALLQALETSPDLVEPRIFPAAANVLRAHELLRQTGIDETQPIAVFITQTSPTQRKSWRPERFRAVAATLHRDHAMQIVFAGTAGEAPAIEQLRSELPFPTASVAGQTGLLDLAALLALADVSLTLDTGPMHLARAMRLPLVVIAPAWSPPIEWLPLNNPRARCLKNADMPEQTPGYIIDEVSVAEVEQNLRELLTLYPPRTFTWRTPLPAA